MMFGFMTEAVTLNPKTLNPVEWVPAEPSQAPGLVDTFQSEHFNDFIGHEWGKRVGVADVEGKKASSFGGGKRQISCFFFF